MINKLFILIIVGGTIDSGGWKGVITTKNITEDKIYTIQLVAANSVITSEHGYPLTVPSPMDDRASNQC